MNIRDNVEVCGYCGGEIPQQPERSSGGKAQNTPQRTVPKKAPVPADEPGDNPEGEEEEEGGLSKILQPGEQVLIGSLNISVKKFFFHAYLTNTRIFLIDTQEKKLKVTAKDIPRDTIAGSIVESSENSDPVLVLSIKSADDEVKTMKLVFAQNGTDRSGEIDDWIALLHEEPQQKKSRKAAPPAKERAPEPEEEEPEPEEEAYEEPEPPARPAKPAYRQQELEPTRKPAKSHERQPPVKRLIPISREPEPEPEPEEEEEPELPQKRTQFRTIEEPPKKKSFITREIPAVSHTDTQIVRKAEVNSAVRSAMKNPVQPVYHPVVKPVKSATGIPIRRPLPEPEPVEEAEPAEIPTVRRRPVAEEPAENPQFCHNCGKKLPAEANFCPGCGTKIGHTKTEPSLRSATIPRPAPSPARSATTNPHQRKVPHIEEVREDDDEEPVIKKPQVKKTPRGSDMTILHKFLRR